SCTSFSRTDNTKATIVAESTERQSVRPDGGQRTDRAGSDRSDGARLTDLVQQLERRWSLTAESADTGQYGSGACGVPVSGTAPVSTAVGVDRLLDRRGIGASDGVAGCGCHARRVVAVCGAVADGASLGARARVSNQAPT